MSELRDRALLIGVYRGREDRDLCDEHLAELRQLSDTYGVDSVESIACPLRKIDAATLLGSGKLQELVSRAKELEVQLVILDEDVLPSQQRNLEKLFGVTVMDRTELIIGVFDRHARSREARLQIELAGLRYQLPRLKRMWTHLSRQRGGSLFLKGVGEKQIELDRRLIGNRIERLQRELAEVRQQRALQRSARVKSGVPTFGIVGYTNAGKSTLMNALCGAGVLAEDMLFATLDTTTRKFLLPNNQEVLLVDTVGFIRKLPHQLVEAFKSTLEEAVFADILIHVIDASHPLAAEQAETALEVLRELKANEIPCITVLNKVDSEESSGMVERLRLAYTKTAPVSALEGTGLDRLQQFMMQELAALRREIKLRIPQSDYALVSEIMRRGEIIYQEYSGNDVVMRAHVPVELLHKVEPFIVDGL